VVTLTIADPAAQQPVDLDAYYTWSSPDGSLWAEFFRRQSKYLIRFPAIGDFEISADAAQVLCTPVPGYEYSSLRHLYLNQVLPLALSRQGKLVFHASAVEACGGAIAFAGASGKGKSTLAASFATNAAGFLTDDALVLEREPDGTYWAMPSHPWIRLWEDSHSSVLPADALAAPRIALTAKSRFPAGKGIEYCQSRRRLLKVYVLGDGSSESLAITPVRNAEKLMVWLRNSFQLEVTEWHVLTSKFDDMWRLAQDVQTYHLDYPRSFEFLPELRSALLAHAAET